MIYVSKTKARIIEYVRANPGSAIAEIYNSIGISATNSGTMLSDLVKVGALTRTGTLRYYKYFWSGAEYTEGLKPREEYENDKPHEDLLLKDLENLELTEDQLLYLRNHTHLPRRELARRLGISKVELNQAMQKYGITSKYKPNREEQS